MTATGQCAPVSHSSTHNIKGVRGCSALGFVSEGVLTLYMLILLTVETGAAVFVLLCFIIIQVGGVSGSGVSVCEI